MAYTITYSSSHRSMSKRQIGLAICAYVGILIVVSYLFSEDDSYVMFHVRQATLLFLAELAVAMINFFFVFMSTIPGVPFVTDILNLVIFVFAVIGMFNAAMGKERLLPFVGKYGTTLRV